MSRGVLFFVFGIFILGLVSGVEVDEDILEKFGDGEERVRVLMKVTEGKVSLGFFGLLKADKINVEDIISKEQINKKSGEYVSAYVSESELTELIENGDIESISVEQTYHTFLQDSVGIMNASASWNLESLGLNLTGTEQSVCVIDTGINYSHSDFGGCSSAEFLNGTCAKVVGGWDFCGNDGDCSVEDADVMDVEGHGTHVSGIVAANGGIEGVGKGANIVMMKAANSSGVFFSINIINAIDRCVANASLYNISVISMSLGGGQYTGYCDNVDTGLTNAINDAVAQNISVVVATGNTGGIYNDEVAGISNPACIENATRVTASSKTDTYASYAFRHSFFKDILVATGGTGSGASAINSTVMGGGYGGKIGTSMATPMVAGAIAIINQYLKLSGQSKTPSEISSVLNETGVVLDDSSGSGYNFSRIDVYSAILSLDVDAPNITLVSPVDNHVNLSINHTFTCNATDWQLDNVTLNVWNSTNDLYYNESKNLTGTSNETSFSLTNMSLGEYNWNCLVADVEGNSGYASANFSLTVGGVEVELNSPTNDSYTNVNMTEFNCSAQSDSNYELVNVTFNLQNSSGSSIFNETRNISGFDNATIFNYTFADEGNYSWECVAANNNSNEGNGIRFLVSYDVTSPVISDLGESVTTSSAVISWTTDKAANSSVAVSGGSWANTSNYVLSHSISVSGLSASVEYTYVVTSCDEAGNCEDEAGSFTTSAVVSSGGGGGGGGGSNVKTVSVKAAELWEGKSEALRARDKMSFSLASGGHSLKVESIGADSADIVIESDPVRLTLNVGEEVKLNLSSEIYYDLFVRLNSISGGRANVSVMRIFEAIVFEKPDINETKNISEEIVYGITEVEPERDLRGWIVGVLVLVVVGWFLFNRKKVKGKKTRKNNGKQNKKAKAKTKRKR